MSRAYTRTIALIGGTGLAAGLLRLPLAEPRRLQDVAVTFGSTTCRVLEYVEGYYGALRVIVVPRHGTTIARPDRSPAALVQQNGYEAHVWLFHQLGVSAVYAFSTVGALDLDVPLAGKLCFVVPHDYAFGGHRGDGCTVLESCPRRFIPACASRFRRRSARRPLPRSKRPGRPRCLAAYTFAAARTSSKPMRKCDR